MLATLRVPLFVLIGSMTLAACSGGSDLFGSSSAGDVTTSSVGQAQQAQQAQGQKVDPACGSLAADIDGLRRDGIAEKVDRAAAKKYRMTQKDLTKASQLNKLNADYQERCSTLPRTAAVATAPASASPATAAVAKAATKAAAPAAKAAAAKAVPAAATVVGKAAQ
jgi:hypothetical protein